MLKDVSGVMFTLNKGGKTNPPKSVVVVRWSPLAVLCFQPPSCPHVAALGPAHLNMTREQLVLQHICILARLYVYFQRIKISECG